MEFSYRDVHSTTASVLRNERGQGIIEYILILVVTCVLILVGLYSLNSAFKKWANNYFGNYIACLLESGELPNISGGGGDGGICNDIFQPFSLAEGRRLSSNYTPPESNPTRTPGTTERRGSGGSGGYSRGGGSGGGGGAGGGGSFSGGTSFGKGSRNKPAGARKVSSAAYTGSTGASDYGSNGSGRRSKISAGLKKRLDNKFAFDEERERRQKRTIASSLRRSGEDGTKAPPIRIKREAVKKKTDAGVDGGLSLPDFLKYLIIAGIIIALFVLLGGQGLQINKSME